jgi:hypothetical protein
MERLALFEGRVQALKNMREELYQSLIGTENNEKSVTNVEAKSTNSSE